MVVRIEESSSNKRRVYIPKFSYLGFAPGPMVMEYL